MFNAQCCTGKCRDLPPRPRITLCAKLRSPAWNSDPFSPFFATKKQSPVADSDPEAQIPLYAPVPVCVSCYFVYQLYDLRNEKFRIPRPASEQIVPLCRHRRYLR